MRAICGEARWPGGRPESAFEPDPDVLLVVVVAAPEEAMLVVIAAVFEGRDLGFRQGDRLRLARDTARKQRLIASDHEFEDLEHPSLHPCSVQCPEVPTRRQVTRRRFPRDG